MNPVFPLFPSAYWAKHAPHQTALVWEKGNASPFPALTTPLSWQQFHQLLQQSLMHLTQKYGAFSDRTIAYCGENKLIGLLCYLSVIATRGRILMLNPALPPTQQQQLLEENAVDVCLRDQDFAEFSPDLTACFSAFAMEWDEQLPATLTLTSGSSGQPKAAVHTLSAHLLNAEGVCRLMQFEQTACWLLSLPLFHVSGQGIIWRWLLKGATLHINEAKADFYAALAKVSHASLVPTQLFRYLQQETESLTTQKILLGGSHIPADLIEAAQKAGIHTFSGYGLTEAASTVCATTDSIESVGMPLYGREVKIQNGQIYLKSACLALGYWQQGTIVPFTDSQGWFATKDKGYWTKNGELVVEGRLDNMFISGGENIQPEQIESVLYASGMVQTVFVVPLADAEFGQRPVALVEFTGSFSIQAVEKLQHFAQLHLEKFKQPLAYYPLANYLTDTAGIKISRHRLQKALSQMTTRLKNG